MVETADPWDINGAEFTATKPRFTFREVVSAKLDGTASFEGAITKIEKTDKGYLYTVVERPDAEDQGIFETIYEEDLVRYNNRGE